MATKEQRKWVTRLGRDTERKIYFYLALIMSAVWIVKELIET
ncbi:hypothetical protein Deba_2965 [Desulfarculus baarsii DSM 2075]|uniref:Uncharacterized protein n=1 Tax=Desulfarculus baarsii (strain ATCC 33931 / DSM 2075 / LMG 7858 / VKM B-1802 / 2st14) TaxID=644282 RepID=E1QKV9_DESB2|nr:hypothetical protein Deba_2965 [Desulfarculus baarsii DSM 2075]